jgi:arginine/lysine/ornithine decarboxylase
MDLGADLSCDSAHKTLPALTGAAYLHLNRGLPDYFYEGAKDAMALFGSTSPSYLILESLDLMNTLLADEFPKKISEHLPLCERFKKRLADHGFALTGNEPMKVTLLPKAFGYTGEALAAQLRKNNIECEFADRDCLVFMLSPYVSEEELTKTADALTALPRRAPMNEAPPAPHVPRRACSIREAMLAPSECIPIEKALGRTVCSLAIGCPPAVPPVVCGEVADEKTIEILRYYGINECRVMLP